MITVGVDIGAYSIKVADLEATSRSYVIRRLQEFPLSLDLTKDRKIEIIDTLRTLFAQYDPANTQFVFAVPQKCVSTRYLNFPFRERFKIQKAAVSQLEDELPFSQEDAVFDSKIVRFSGKGADVLSMAVPRDRVSDVLNLAHDCGVEPVLISSDSLGLCNLFSRWDEPPPEGLPPAQEIPSMRQADIILNVGHLTTEVLVYTDGILVGLRTVDWGAKNMADAIGQKYGLNYLQAMRELQTKGFVLLDKSQATREQVAFSQVIEGSLHVLASDLRLKLLELQSEFNLQWRKGHLLGGGSLLKNLGHFMTQVFQIPFNRFKQFEHHPAVSFEATSHLEMVMGTAIGLALEGLRRPRNPATNFLKGDLARTSHPMEALWEQWGHTAKVIGAAFLLFTVYAMFRDSFAAHLLEQSDQALKTQAEAVAGLKGRAASSSGIRRFITAQERIEKARKQAEKVDKLNSALSVLNLISASVPPRTFGFMEIKRLSIDGETAEVHGFTNTSAERDLVGRALSKAAVGRVDPIDPKIPAPSGKTGFAYRFRVMRMSGG